jgi:beta-lactamase class A
MSRTREEAQQEIERLVAEVDGEIGVAAWPVGSPELAIGIDMDGLYPTASTFKVPVLYSLFKLVDEGEVDLNTRIPHSHDNLSAGSGVLQYLQAGLEPTIADLATLMIIVSDNHATDQLHRMIGPDRIHADLKALDIHNIEVPIDCKGIIWHMVGLDPNNPEHTYEACLAKMEAQEYAEDGIAFNTTLGGGNDISSPRDMTRLCEAIELGTGISASSREKMIQIMRAQQHTQRIPAGVPQGVKVANKTGSIKGTRNDTAIVHAKKPYVVSVFSKNLAGPNVADKALVDISAAIWSAFGEEQA